MKPVALVSDYMARDLLTLSPETEINHAMNLLLKRRFSGAPVVDASGALVGVLSKKDCLRAAIEASYYRSWGGTVGAHMSTDVQTLDAGTDILTAAEAFVASNFRRFPVMQSGRLVGQISRADVLQAISDNWG
jgi:CBS domain-containing protein